MPGNATKKCPRTGNLYVQVRRQTRAENPGKFQKLSPQSKCAVELVRGLDITEAIDKPTDSIRNSTSFNKLCPGSYTLRLSPSGEEKDFEVTEKIDQSRGGLIQAETARGALGTAQSHEGTLAQSVTIEAGPTRMHYYRFYLPKPTIAIEAPKVVVVTNAWVANPKRIKVTLGVTPAFQGKAKLSCTPAGAVKIYSALSGGGEVTEVEGAALSAGYQCYAEAQIKSRKKEDTALRIQLEKDGVAIEGAFAEDKLTCVELKLQHKGPHTSFTDSPTNDRLYVHKDTELEFRLVQDPPRSGVGTWGGDAGASGSDVTTRVTFTGNSASADAAGAKVVEATCFETVRARVTVFELTPRLVPTDNFAGRSLTDLGVGEEAQLDFTVVPAGVSAATAGGFQWKKTSGKGKLSHAGNDGKADFTAPDRAQTVSLKLEILGGPSQGLGPTRDIGILEPSGVHMEQAASTSVWHIHDVPSAGFKAEIYLTPATVSFANITISEGDCASTVTGYFTGTRLQGVHHAGHGAGVWVTVGNVTVGIGSKVDGTDDIKSGGCDFGTPYAAGTFDWPIPWKFRVGSGSAKHFATVHHHMTINDTGGMTVSKGGVSVSTHLGDPDS